MESTGRAIFLMLTLVLAVLQVPESISQEIQSQQMGYGRPVVVSERVGEIIDLGERNAFELFLFAKHFKSAVFYQRPDSSYVAVIYLGEAEEKSVRLQEVDQATFLRIREHIDYFGREHVKDNTKSADPLVNNTELWKKRLVQIKTGNNRKWTGVILHVPPDSVVSIMIKTSTSPPGGADWKMIQIPLNSIARITVSRKRADSLWSSSRGCVVSGSMSALKSVHLDVPWKGRSEHEKMAILSQLRKGTYRSPHVFRVSPWIGVFYPPETSAVAAMGVRLRFYLTPKSGFEMAYGRADWVHRNYPYTWHITEASTDYVYGGNFFSFTREWPANPFAAWGLGWVSTRLTNHDFGSGIWKAPVIKFALSFYLGIEIPVTRWLSLEMRGGDVWEFLSMTSPDHHLNVQCGLTFGSNY